VTISKINSINF